MTHSLETLLHTHTIKIINLKYPKENMFMCIHKPSDQRELYFELNKAIKYMSEQLKTQGCYVIYKDGICLYVGQSTNIASRLATHLCGKYKSADRIFVYDVESSKSLLESEKFLIQKFTPIENIIANYTDVINYDLLDDCLKEYVHGESIYHSYELIIDKHYIMIGNSEITLCLYESQNIRNQLSCFIDEVKK